MSAEPQVTILGGGFGGLETALHLRRRLGERVDLRLVSERDPFRAGVAWQAMDLGLEAMAKSLAR